MKNHTFNSFKVCLLELQSILMSLIGKMYRCKLASNNLLNEKVVLFSKVQMIKLMRNNNSNWEIPHPFAQTMPWPMHLLQLLSMQQMQAKT